MFRKLRKTKEEKQQVGDSSNTNQDNGIGASWYKSSPVQSPLNSPLRERQSLGQHHQHHIQQRTAPNTSGTMPLAPAGMKQPHSSPPAGGAMQNRRFSSKNLNAPSNSEDRDLFSLILKGNEWNSCIQTIEHNPMSAKQQQTVTLQGLQTVAYPLHAAVCLNPHVSECVHCIFLKVSQRTGPKRKMYTS